MIKKFEFTGGDADQLPFQEYIHKVHQQKRRVQILIKDVPDKKCKKKIKNNYVQTNKILEHCAHCDKEVLIKSKMKVQKCPYCGKKILPCSLCDTLGIKDKSDSCLDCQFENMLDINMGLT